MSEGEERVTKCLMSTDPITWSPFKALFYQVRPVLRLLLGVVTAAILEN